MSRCDQGFLILTSVMQNHRKGQPGSKMIRVTGQCTTQTKKRPLKLSLAPFNRSLQRQSDGRIRLKQQGLIQQVICKIELTGIQLKLSKVQKESGMPDPPLEHGAIGLERIIQGASCMIVNQLLQIGKTCRLSSPWLFGLSRRSAAGLKSATHSSLSNPHAIISA
jgi:hypothetical protein